MGRDPPLGGQTVLVIGGSSGIGLETARLARAEEADVIITGRSPDRVYRAGRELGASIAAFDATDVTRLERFLAALPVALDHVLVSGSRPCCASPAEIDLDEARRCVEAHFWTLLQVARKVGEAVRPGGSLLFIGSTGGGAPAVGPVTTLATGLPALTKSLALKLAPIRVNRIAVGFVDTPGAAAILGDQLDARREQLRTTLPIRRVVEPADVAALALHLMTNTAITGATVDIDGGQQLIER
jgi:NAD(P)-dependent dehydrogenase (short-subunit alcohol dehydrogenase family)